MRSYNVRSGRLFTVRRAKVHGAPIGSYCLCHNSGPAMSGPVIVGISDKVTDEEAIRYLRRVTAHLERQKEGRRRAATTKKMQRDKILFDIG